MVLWEEIISEAGTSKTERKVAVSFMTIFHVNQALCGTYGEFGEMQAWVLQHGRNCRGFQTSCASRLVWKLVMPTILLNPVPPMLYPY